MIEAGAESTRTDDRTRRIQRDVEPIRGDEDAACRYEDAEEAFLAAIRADHDRAALTALADNVATRAKAWNAKP